MTPQVDTCKLGGQRQEPSPGWLGEGSFACSGQGVILPVQIPDRMVDGETYVTTKEAAALMRVAVSTVSRWKAKGYLKPVPGSPPRKPIYAYTDVTDAEYRARQEALKASGSDRQVQRDYDHGD